MKNDGWSDIEYDFGDNKELNKTLSEILNEACHVFHHHAEGQWKDSDKPAYAKLLATHISEKPSLIKKLLKLKDPVISNITYAAIEIVQNENRT